MDWDREQQKMAKAKEILDEMERLSFDKSISDEEKKARWERVYKHVEELQALRNSHSVTTRKTEVATLDTTNDRIEELEKMVAENKIDLEILWEKQAKIERELLRLKGTVS
ncbi:hypothetical protein [Paenibacillus radicis (ex Gao et al. 2016)]|uniref:Uncharacterized protein n=1 Tax=Paenibacillus radicis (ex Gao et al. 2016) TaxID=1737354 RepID=A0A917HJX7_9BACL|nr:hypothetical protein [Paenibacillus radicis (ex Gao et al. 2016)]GGG82086.1 hypothetical protein GCM10010918_44290 [Paenibacillus radicis (ex Gao et al. 2016)]